MIDKFDSYQQPEHSNEASASRAKKYLARAAGLVIVAPVVVFGVQETVNYYQNVTTADYELDLDAMVGGSQG